MKNMAFLYQGRSMWPYFQEGDLLEYLPCQHSLVKVGDCIVFKNRDNRLVVHRVTAKGVDLSTKGDASPSPDDEPVNSNNLRGRVVQRTRFGRTTKVCNGVTGRCVGLFYRYVGRIDPYRAARGGEVARFIQKVSMSWFNFIWQRGTIKRLLTGRESNASFWVLGNRVIGKQDLHTGEWSVAWPWSLLLKLPDDLK